LRARSGTNSTGAPSAASPTSHGATGAVPSAAGTGAWVLRRAHANASSRATPITGSRFPSTPRPYPNLLSTWTSFSEFRECLDAAVASLEAERLYDARVEAVRDTAAHFLPLFEAAGKADRKNAER
jgi:hypothetical protein